MPSIDDPPLTAQALAEAFENGAYAASLHEFSLRAKTPREVHVLLGAHGYVCRRLPLVAHRTRTGAPQWRTRRGVTNHLSEAACEYVYTNPDGAIVRVFPDRGPTVGFDQLVREKVPFARCSLARQRATAVDWTSECAVVTEKKVAVPGVLRASGGLRIDRRNHVAAFRLARVVFAEQDIPLSPLRDWGLPAIPITEARGLSGGLTLVPQRDFSSIEQLVRRDAANDEAIAVREDGADVHVFFAGHRDVGKWLPSACYGLASLTLHRGAYVLGIDPAGHEPSVEALVIYVIDLLRRIGEVRAYDNVTGADVTAKLGRVPSVLLSSLDPSVVHYDGEDRGIDES